MNVTPTVEVIYGMSNRLRSAADELDRIAKRMISKEDLTLASEALQEISNMNGNLRLDLLVTRPVREYEREMK